MASQNFDKLVQMQRECTDHMNAAAERQDFVDAQKWKDALDKLEACSDEIQSLENQQQSAIDQGEYLQAHECQQQIAQVFTRLVDTGEEDDVLLDEAKTSPTPEPVAVVATKNTPRPEPLMVDTKFGASTPASHPFQCACGRATEYRGGKCCEHCSGCSGGTHTAKCQNWEVWTDENGWQPFDPGVSFAVDQNFAFKNCNAGKQWVDYRVEFHNEVSASQTSVMTGRVRQLRGPPPVSTYFPPLVDTKFGPPVPCEDPTNRTTDGVTPEALAQCFEKNTKKRLTFTEWDTGRTTLLRSLDEQKAQASLADRFLVAHNLKQELDQLKTFHDRTALGLEQSEARLAEVLAQDRYDQAHHLKMKLDPLWERLGELAELDKVRLFAQEDCAVTATREKLMSAQEAIDRLLRVIVCDEPTVLDVSNNCGSSGAHAQQEETANSVWPKNGATAENERMDDETETADSAWPKDFEAGQGGCKIMANKSDVADSTWPGAPGCISCSAQLLVAARVCHECGEPVAAC